MKPKLHSRDAATHVLKPSEGGGQGPSASEVSYLIVLAGAGAGQMFRVEPETVLGRDDSALVRLPDEAVSRVHARITVDGALVTLADLGSTNGTYVNGKRLAGAVSLRDGDKISMGSTTVLKFTLGRDLEQRFREAILAGARQDGPSGIWGRAYFEERLKAEFAYASRPQLPLAVLLIDADHFKAVNDLWGETLGDVVLAALANRLRFSLRTEDAFARYGGEKFAVICRSTTEAPALSLAERLRREVGDQAFSFPLAFDRPVSISVSIGVALYPRPGVTIPAQLLAAADQALDEAKHSGRNTVRLARPPRGS